jgi:exosome complex RNA-binding protein Rrp4
MGDNYWNEVVEEMIKRATTITLIVAIKGRIYINNKNNN